MKKTLQLLISISLGGLVMWLVFRNIDLKETLSTILSTDIKWMLYSGIFTFLAHIFRGFRWSLMLDGIGEKTSGVNTSTSVLIGYLANLAFPRAGEFARCASLNKLEGTPVEKSFGVVIAERVVDLLILLILLTINLVFEFERIKTFFYDLIIAKFIGKSYLAPILTLLLIAFAGVCFLIYRYKTKILSISLFKKLYDFILGLWEGITAIGKLKKPWLFVVYTVSIWLMYYLAAYILFFALPSSSNLSLLAGLTILVMGSFGMAAPTQGGIGAYHYLVGNIVVLYGLTLQEGITLATFLHASQTIYVIIFGILALIYSNIIQKKQI